MPKENPTSFPKQAQLFLTEVCSEGCSYCPYGNLSSKEKKKFLSNELTISEWKRAVNFLYEEMKIRLFFLIGGEPVLKKGLEKLVQHINDNLPSATVVLSTSGAPLLRNPKLLQKLIDSGLNKIVVSVNGIKGNLDKGKERKSYLGLCFLRELRQKYTQKKFILSANCIVNKETLPDLLNTYQYLAKNKVYLNLCPEQTICFKTSNKALFTTDDRRLLNQIVKKLITIKEKGGNFLVPSKYYLQSLTTTGISQLYQCSSENFPNTLHLASNGSIPFCIWRRGSFEQEYNIMDFVSGKKKYCGWSKKWLKDKDGSNCSCSWSFLDRVGGFGVSKNSLENNFWYRYSI